MKEIVVSTNKKKEVVDITERIQDHIEKEDLKEGLINLFLTHTTAAITTADLDPGTDLDMLDAFEELIPKLNFRHPHNPSHTSDHILSTIIGASVTVPVKNGKLILGTWQRIILVELDGPRERNIIFSIIS